MRMQQLAWGSPLDVLQSFDPDEADKPQEPKPSDKP
jgi:putative (di)nucleoside polyphosphate hydrolase